MTVMISMREIEERGRREGVVVCQDASSGEQVRICVLEPRRFSIPDVGSLGQRVFPTLGCTVCTYLFLASNTTLYTLLRRDALACFEWLDPSPVGVARKSWELFSDASSVISRSSWQIPS
jgi:hypothetical protein